MQKVFTQFTKEMADSSEIRYVKGVSVAMLPLHLRQRVREIGKRSHTKEYIRILVRYLRWGVGLTTAVARTKEVVPV